MGVIQKQGVSNSIILLLGAAIGAFNVLVLYPLILPKEYFGLTNVLVQVAFIAAQFGLLGAQISIVKFWNTLKSNFLLFRFLSKNAIAFTMIVLLGLFFCKSAIIAEYQDKEALFTEHYNYLFLLVVFSVIMNFFSAISQANLKTSFPFLLKEILLRIYQTILLLTFYFKWITLDSFIMYFVVGYGLEALVILAYTLKQKLLSKPLNKLLITTKSKKEIFKYSAVNFLTGFSGSIVVRLDILMIGALLVNPLIENYGLKSVAVYTVAMYVTNIIEMPARGVFKISAPIIARLINKDNMAEVGLIYKKASINLIIVSVLFLLLLWSSVNELLFFVPEYKEAKWIILILGLSKVFNMGMGVNNIIVAASKYYRVGTYIMVLLILITFGFNYLFIPKYGLEGAAMGSLLSIIFFNLVTFLFILFKFGLQPFSWNTLKTLLLGLLLFLCFSFVDIEYELLSIVVKSLGISSIYLLIIYKLELSSDINGLIKKGLSKLF